MINKDKEVANTYENYRQYLRELIRINQFSKISDFKHIKQYRRGKELTIKQRKNYQYMYLPIFLHLYLPQLKLL